MNLCTKHRLFTKNYFSLCTPCISAMCSREKNRSSLTTLNGSQHRGGVKNYFKMLLILNFSWKVCIIECYGYIKSYTQTALTDPWQKIYTMKAIESRRNCNCNCKSAFFKFSWSCPSFLRNRMDRNRLKRFVCVCLKKMDYLEHFVWWHCPMGASCVAPSRCTTIAHLMRVLLVSR